MWYLTTGLLTQNKVWVAVLLMIHLTYRSFAQIIPPFPTRQLADNRYDDIKGSPYLYDEWKYASLLTRDSTLVKYVLLNYNGYEKQFEIKYGHITATFDDRLFDRITVYMDDTLSDNVEWFVRGLHFDIATELVNVIYDGRAFKLIRGYKVRLVKLSDDFPGTTLERYRFAQDFYYMLLYQDKLYMMRLTRNRFIKVIGNRELINKIIVENQLDISKETDVVRFLELLEQSLSKINP